MAAQLTGGMVVPAGQSNAQFSLAQIGQQGGYDAAGEIAKADGYPGIRTMTVGPSSHKPFGVCAARTLNATDQSRATLSLR